MNDTAPRTCAYPGCENVVSSDPQHGGPPSGYCDLPEHNAHTMFLALKRGEGNPPPDTAARLGLRPKSEHG